MKRFSRIVLWLLLVELVISVAVGTRLRNQLERPVQYLGATAVEGSDADVEIRRTPRPLS
jgi:hypothetical protein